MPCVENGGVVGMENMILMDDLTELSILHNLQLRYKNGYIYVSSANELILKL